MGERFPTVEEIGDARHQGGVGSAESVDRLFGVTNPDGPAHHAVQLQKERELHGAGILKLVNHDDIDPFADPLLHVVPVGKQTQEGCLQVIVVGDAAVAFVPGKLIEGVGGAGVHALHIVWKSVRNSGASQTRRAMRWTGSSTPVASRLGSAVASSTHVFQGTGRPPATSVRNCCNVSVTCWVPLRGAAIAARWLTAVVTAAMRSAVVGGTPRVETVVFHRADGGVRLSAQIGGGHAVRPRRSNDRADVIAPVRLPAVPGPGPGAAHTPRRRFQRFGDAVDRRSHRDIKDPVGVRVRQHVHIRGDARVDRVFGKQAKTETVDRADVGVGHPGAKLGMPLAGERFPNAAAQLGGRLDGKGGGHDPFRLHAAADRFHDPFGEPVGFPGTGGGADYLDRIQKVSCLIHMVPRRYPQITP